MGEFWSNDSLKSSNSSSEQVETSLLEMFRVYKSVTASRWVLDFKKAAILDADEAKVVTGLTGGV